ncbi:MAG: hypothetical protein KDA52_05330 [Planctomycetaceae bacterium]|nr:hypothetical protein [Planctomycetaceae bacterium]
MNDTAVDDEGIRHLSDAVKLGEIHLHSDLITDKSLEVLSKLPALTSMLLDGVPHVTNRGVAILSRCEGITELYLKGTAIDDKCGESLGKLSQVWSLNLSDTNITDAILPCLSSMNRLKMLTLDNTGVTGIGFVALPSSVRRLYVEGCSVRDVAAAVVAENLPALRTLNLNYTLVTDKALEPLSKLADLSNLRLSHTQVTDAGMQCLAGHAELMMLYLEGTAVTAECITWLKEQSPNDLIVYS